MDRIQKNHKKDIYNLGTQLNLQGFGSLQSKSR